MFCGNWHVWQALSTSLTPLVSEGPHPLTCADFEAAVVEAPAVVILVPAHEDIGETGLANADWAQDDDTGAGEQILIVRDTPRAWNKDQELEL